MKQRLLRLLVFIITVATFPANIPISTITWLFNGHFYTSDLIEWALTGDDEIFQKMKQ